VGAHCRIGFRIPSPPDEAGFMLPPASAAHDASNLVTMALEVKGRSL
jgi:hypothetical protein